MAYDPLDPKQNIFAYGGNTVNPDTGETTPQVNPATGTINSAVLTPTPQINYRIPNPSPLPSVSGLDATPPAELTQPENAASELNARLRQANEQLVGESAFRTETEKTQGIPELQKRQTELTSRLKSLQNEALAIPQQLQLDATGRGTTAGGLRPLETARLRENAIQALGVSSLLEASRGNLTLAQDLVDRAVKAKYDPIREEIATKTANLDLILKSPEYTLAEKNRAQRQLDIQKKKDEDRKKKEEDTKTIMSWAAAALANGASPLQAEAITRIATSDNPDLRTAFAAYAPFSRDPQALQAALLDLEAKRADISYKKAQSAKIYSDMRKDSVLPGENPQLYSGLSNPTATAVRAKVGNFKSEPGVQNFAVIQEGRNFALSIPNNTKNPADDQALIYSLAKALDPGSVVREGEYATAQKYSQSWVKAYGKGIEQAVLGTGFLSDTARENIKKTIEQKYNASKKSYENLYSQYAKNIGTLTGRNDGDKFLSDYSVPSPSTNIVKFRDPKTGQVKGFQGLTQEEIKDAINQGYIQIL